MGLKQGVNWGSHTGFKTELEAGMPLGIQDEFKRGIQAGVSPGIQRGVQTGILSGVFPELKGGVKWGIRDGDPTFAHSSTKTAHRFPEGRSNPILPRGLARILGAVFCLELLLFALLLILLPREKTGPSGTLPPGSDDLQVTSPFPNNKSRGSLCGRV